MDGLCAAGNQLNSKRSGFWRYPHGHKWNCGFERAIVALPPNREVSVSSPAGGPSAPAGYINVEWSDKSALAIENLPVVAAHHPLGTSTIQRGLNMVISNSFRTVLVLLAVAVLAGLLTTACGPACGRLCDSDFWIDENENSTNPSVADVQTEIDDGADLEGPEDGLSPLGWALGRGSPEVVELLLESGADPKADQHLFLCVLTADDSIETAQKMDLMLYHGADVNLECRLGGTPLTKALQASGNVQLVETMILYGADVNVEGGGGMTPLIWAAMGRSDKREVRGEMVRLLLQHGADPNAGTGLFGSPLHSAVGLGSTDSVRALLEYGARLDVTDNKGRTPCQQGRELMSGDVDQETRSAWPDIMPLVC